MSIHGAYDGIIGKQIFIGVQKAVGLWKSKYSLRAVDGYQYNQRMKTMLIVNFSSSSVNLDPSFRLIENSDLCAVYLFDGDVPAQTRLVSGIKS